MEFEHIVPGDNEGGVKVESVDDVVESPEKTFAGEKGKGERRKEIERRYKRLVEDEPEGIKSKIEDIRSAEKEYRKSVEELINEAYGNHIGRVVNLGYRLGIIDQDTIWRKYQGDLLKQMAKHKRRGKSILEKLEGSQKELAELKIERAELFELKRNVSEMIETTSKELEEYEAKYKELNSNGFNSETQKEINELLTQAIEKRAYLKKLENYRVETSLKINQIMVRIEVAKGDVEEIEYDYTANRLDLYEAMKKLVKTPRSVQTTRDVIQGLLEAEQLRRIGTKYDKIVDRLEEINSAFRVRYHEASKSKHDTEETNGRKKGLRNLQTNSLIDLKRVAETYVGQSDDYERQVRQSDSLFK